MGVFGPVGGWGGFLKEMRRSQPVVPIGGHNIFTASLPSYMYIFFFFAGHYFGGTFEPRRCENLR